MTLKQVKRKAKGDVVDIEADDIQATKIHCVSVNRKGKLRTLQSYDNMRKYINQAEIIVGHNFIRYDRPTLERILGVKCNAIIVDTLALSWYLEPNRPQHGLESYGEDYGIPKPKINDWKNLSAEEYKHRCEEDVKINTKLWETQWKQLLNMYGTEEEAWRFIEYLMFKMECAAEQERRRWKLDVPKAEKLKDDLTKVYQEAIAELEAVMPEVPVYKTKTKPAKCFKQDKSLSAHGEKWFKLLEELGEDKDVEEVRFIESHKEPNAASDPQLKAWLFGLGWIPCTFKYVRDKKSGDVRPVPQVRTKNGDNEPILTKSVERLIEAEPAVAKLERVGLIKHRLDVVSGFLDNVDDQGYIQAKIKGFTNTLRFKHTVVVNLPGVDKPYGKDLRGCLIAPEGTELCGSDMAALEDRTKQHYMWDYDPEYVKTMQAPDYCPHCDIAVLAGYLTKEQAWRFGNDAFIDKEDAKEIKGGRKAAKPVNYGGVYGQGPEGLARETGMSLAEATKLNKIYWERNWSVKKVAEDQEVRQFNGMKWLRNPVSGFWYSLRSEKDRFSTLNQGTGVYCFDMWVMKLRAKKIPIIAQFHDEVCAIVKKGIRPRVEKAFRAAIKEVNDMLKLNRDLDIDVQFGDNYSEIH